MKNQILLLAFVAITTFSFAQQNTSFGIRGGVTSSSMNGDAVKNLQNLLDFTNGMVTTSNRNGFYAGGFANIPFTKNFSIEPGVYYAQKGYQLNGSLNVKGMEFIGINAKAELQQQYIDIPLLLKADISGFQLFAGPQISYLLKSDLRTSAGVLGFNFIDRKMDATDQFNKLDAGITGGIGYQFSNGLNMMASYDYGLTKVDANRNLDTYNRVLKVGIGFEF